MIILLVFSRCGPKLQKNQNIFVGVQHFQVPTAMPALTPGKHAHTHTNTLDSCVGGISTRTSSSIMYPVDGGSVAVYFVTTPLRGSTALRVYLRSRGRWQTTVEQPLICFRMTFWRESVSIRPWTISTYATSQWSLPARETYAVAAKFGSENSANGKPLNQFNWGQATLFFLSKLTEEARL